MDAHVLGPVSVKIPGKERLAGTKKATELFGLLVTSSELRCTKEEIAACLWPGADDVDQRLYQVVRELRGMLGEEILPRNRSGTYTIHIPEGSVDYLRFRDGIQKAHRLMGKDRFDQLCVALKEWGDADPLHGFPDDGFRVRKANLKEEWIEAVEFQLETAWEIRKIGWLCREAEKFHKLLPHRSNIFRFYLLAHGSALSPVRRDKIIRQWIRRYGDPDYYLRVAIDQVSGGSRAGSTQLLYVPDELPACERQVFGRDELISGLADVVLERKTSGKGALVVLTGMAGVGKSTVAYSVVRKVKRRFPDGILYADLHGFSDDGVQSAEPEHILDRFLSKLVPYSSAVGFDDKCATLRSALVRKSVLVLLDDVTSAKQVLPLLPSTGASVVLVTSRTTLGDLRSRYDTFICRVDVLDPDAAMEILQEGLAPADLRKYSQSFSKIARQCGYLALALIVIARRMEGRPSRTIPDFARELAEGRRKLDALDVPEHELSVRVALDCSVRALSEEARCLLWQLTVHPGPSIGWEAVMDLGLVRGGLRADRALEELTAANLVDLHDDRYRLHDLVRDFARNHVIPMVFDRFPDFTDITIRQVLEHQLHNVRACDRVLDGQRELPLGHPNRVTVIDPDDLEQAMAVLDGEYETVLRGIQLADDQGMNRYRWLIPMALVTYQWRRRRLSDALWGLTISRDTVEMLAGDVSVDRVSSIDRAMVYRMVAGTHWRRKEFVQAEGQLNRAVLLSKEDMSEYGQLSLARSLHALALTLRKQKREPEAYNNHRQALELYQDLSEPIGMAAALNGIGTLHYDRNEYDEALSACSEAFRILDGTTDLNGRADVLYTLAKIHREISERDVALSLYRRACVLYRELDNWPNEDKVLWFYADLLVASGRSREAVKALERVQVLRELMGGEDVGEVRDRLEGLR